MNTLATSSWHLIALDGKTLRGIFDHLHDRTTTHLLSAFASDAARIQAHREVAVAPEAIGDVQALIRDLGITGALVIVVREAGGSLR